MFAHNTGNSNKSSGDEADDETVVEPDQGNGKVLRQVNIYWHNTDFRQITASFTVLSHIISQLRPGADLSRVTLPTFILEPRSMLERITKYVGSYDGEEIINMITG